MNLVVKTFVAFSVCVVHLSFGQIDEVIDEVNESDLPELGSMSSDGPNEVLSLENELDRVISVPSVRLPFDGTQLATVITTIGMQADMQMISPRIDDFGDLVYLNVKSNPFKVLEILSKTYGYKMDYDESSGLWTFVREAPGKLVGKFYTLNNTDLSSFSLGGSGDDRSNEENDSSGISASGKRSIERDGEQLVAMLEKALAIKASGFETIILEQGESIPDRLLKEAVASNLKGEEQSRVIAIPDSHSLLVVAPMAQHSLVEGIIAKADQPVEQVEVRLTVLETNLPTSLILGTDWTNFQPEMTISEFSQSIDFNDLNDTIWPSEAQYSSSDMAVQFNFLEKAENSNVFNEAHATTRDGRSAYMSVGEEIPYQTSSFKDSGLGGLGGTETKIKFVRTGISAEVHVSVFGEGDDRKVSCAVNWTNGVVTRYAPVGEALVPVVKDQRNQFEVYIKDGYTQAFGGFATASNSQVDQGVPGLRKIPVFGGMFGKKSSIVEDRNVIAYLTVRIVDPMKKSEEKPDVESIRDLAKVESREKKSGIDVGRSRR